MPSSLTNQYSVILPSMLLARDMVTCTGHIGIHEGADGRTDVDDVMAIKPNFLTSMAYHIFLTMVLRARAPSARAELR